MPAEMPPFRCVSLPREQYLRKEEVRIRDAALPIHNSDPAVSIHVNIIFELEDMMAMHETAAFRHREAGRAATAGRHFEKIHALQQMKFHHLDQLAHLLI